jgi:BlaI family transcriptional regulator, penicillinase repressor
VDTPKLGPLEMRVVGLLEDLEPQSVADIQRALEGEGQALAYTTVMTVLTRLHDKGVIARVKQSRRYLYTTSSATGAVKDGILNRIRQGLFRSNRLRPIVSLLEQEELSADELRALRRVIDQRLKDKSS